MKHTLLLIFSLLVFTLSAQVTITPTNQVMMLDISKGEVEVPINIANGFDTEMELLWRMELSDGFPADWHTFICDWNTCHLPETRECPPNRANTIASRETQGWTFHADARGFVGEGTVTIHILDTSGNILATATVDVVAQPVSVEEIEDFDAINVFPNPTANYFQISEDEHVKQIGVYSLIGKKIMITQHDQGSSYDISDFRNGIYLVRMMDENGEVIKTVRLSKR